MAGITPNPMGAYSPWRPGPVPHLVGNIFSDAIDAVGSVGAGLVDDIESIPGIGDLVSSALDDLKSFAKTPIGQIFLTVCAPEAVSILWSIPLVGPVVADVGWALPGLAKGEKLSTAAAETITRYVSAAGAGDVGSEAADEFSQQFPDASSELEDLARQAGKIAGQIPDDPQSIVDQMGGAFGLTAPVDENDLVTAFANKMGMREDFTRLALDGVLGTLGADTTLPGSLFDPATGKRIVPTPLEQAQADIRTAQQTQGTILHALGNSRQALLVPQAQYAASGAKLNYNLSGYKTKATVATAALTQAMHPDATPTAAQAAATLAHDAVNGRPGAIQQGAATGSPLVSTAIQIKARLVNRRAWVDRYLGMKGAA